MKWYCLSGVLLVLSVIVGGMCEALGLTFGRWIIVGGMCVAVFGVHSLMTEKDEP